MATATKTRKMNRNDIAIARVAQVIAAGHVLVAHNSLRGEDTTIGPYHEAVDRGIRFACIGVRGRAEMESTRRAEDAAWWFVMERVGSSRANDAAKAAAKRHGLVLAV
jgi:hypothetical protein